MQQSPALLNAKGGNACETIQSSRLGLNIMHTVYERQRKCDYICQGVLLVGLYRRFKDNHFPGQTFPGQDVSRTSYTKEFSCT